MREIAPFEIKLSVNADGDVCLNGTAGWDACNLEEIGDITVKEMFIELFGEEKWDEAERFVDD